MKATLPVRHLLAALGPFERSEQLELIAGIEVVRINRSGDDSDPIFVDADVYEDTDVTITAGDLAEFVRRLPQDSDVWLYAYPGDRELEVRSLVEGTATSIPAKL